MFSESRVEEAKFWTVKLGLHARLIQLPQGYHTSLARGLTSGLDTGAIQLIGLVRALASAPDLLLLDCADTGLDLASQKLLASALSDSSNRFTCLMVTGSSELASAASICAINKEVKQ